MTIKELMNKNENQKFINFPENYMSKIEIEWAKLKHNDSDDLSFVYLENSNEKNRVFLRRLLNKNATAHHILVSKNKETTELAWKANMFAYIDFKEDEENLNWAVLIERLKKYPPRASYFTEKLKLNYLGGFDIIDIQDIYYCVGDGTYTDIYLENGKKIKFSYSLGNLEKRLSGLVYIPRIGKEFIINLNRIKSVRRSQGKIVFRGKVEIELAMSDLYIKRIKQNLLWY